MILCANERCQASFGSQASDQTSYKGSRFNCSYRLTRFINSSTSLSCLSKRLVRFLASFSLRSRSLVNFTVSSLYLASSSKGSFSSIKSLGSSFSSKSWFYFSSMSANIFSMVVGLSSLSPPSLPFSLSSSLLSSSPMSSVADVLTRHNAWTCRQTFLWSAHADSDVTKEEVIYSHGPYHDAWSAHH